MVPAAHASLTFRDLCLNPQMTLDPRDRVDLDPCH